MWTRKERQRLYNSKRWRALRLRILNRDGRRCQRCGRPGRLEVHHRRPLWRGGAPYEPDNLESLCRACHFIREPDRRTDRLIWQQAIDARAQPAVEAPQAADPPRPVERRPGRQRLTIL